MRVRGLKKDLGGAITGYASSMGSFFFFFWHVVPKTSTACARHEVRASGKTKKRGHVVPRIIDLSVGGVGTIILARIIMGRVMWGANNSMLKGGRADFVEKQES